MISAHLGTLVAVIIYFWNDFKKFYLLAPLEILQNKKKSNFYFFLKIVTSSIPLIIIGAFLKLYGFKYIYSPSIIALSAIIFSLLLLLSDKNDRKKKINDISFKDSFIIGIVQIFALIPGSSRAGLCITASRFLGLDRISSAKYSMYLSIPAISGATFFMLLEIIKKNSMVLWFEIISIFFISFIFAYFTISFFIKLLKKIIFKFFVFYRIIAAVIFLLLLRSM